MMISISEEKIKQGRVKKCCKMWVRSNLNRVIRRDFIKKVALSKYIKLLRQWTMWVSERREYQAGEIP